MEPSEPKYTGSIMIQLEPVHLVQSVRNALKEQLIFKLTIAIF